MDPVTREPLIVCGNRTVDLFSSTYSSPIYKCPQNMYKDSGAGRCQVTQACLAPTALKICTLARAFCVALKSFPGQACPSEKTSATGSTSIDQCFSCQPRHPFLSLLLVACCFASVHLGYRRQIASLARQAACTIVSCSILTIDAGTLQL